MQIPHWRLPLDRLWKLPLGILMLARRLHRWRPDVVFLHGQWAGPAGAVAARLVGIGPLIYVCHWPSFYTDWDLGRVVRNRISEAIPCRFATRVVTLSRGNAHQYLIRQLVPPEKLQLIHNSIDPARVPPPEEAARVRATHGWHDSDVHVVSAGRLSDQKRLDWLLRSWQLVTAKTSLARLWIVGDGPERSALEHLAAELGIVNSCTFLGAQPDGIPYLAAADLVVMTTMYEGFGLVPVEAMACGKALVASAVDGVADTIRDGVEGFLVPPGEVATFAERIVQLIEDPALRQAMGERGKVRVRDFAPAVTMAKYRALIDELLASPAGVPLTPRS